MELYLFRHGIAGEGSPDEARELTARGRKRTRQVVEALQGRWEPRRLVTSPLVRAVQTAEIVADVLKLTPEIAHELRPHGDHRGLTERLLRSDSPDVILVGHEPDLSQLGAWLLSGGELAGLSLKKAGVARFTLRREGEARLRWWLTPGAILGDA